MAKLNQTQVSELYVLLFNMASEGDGNEYWQGMSEEHDTTTLIDHMLFASSEQGVLVDGLGSREFVETLYQNAYGSTADEDGIAYWTEQLETGALNKGGVVWNILEALKEEQTDPVALANQQIFNNRVEVSNYFADNQAEKIGNEEQGFGEGQGLEGITEDAASVAAAKAAIDALGEGGEEPVEPSVPGETIRLTVGQDFEDGTAGDDVFKAYVAQNALGQQVNTLGTGDVLDGGAGFDTLEAQVTTGAWVNGFSWSNMAIGPVTKNIENIVLQAEIAGILENDTVIVNAKDMEGVNKIASNHSDASLVVQNMTSKGVAGGTANMTVGMEYTGNADTSWDESDMTVYFDQDYLVRSAVQSNSLYYFTQDRLATQETNKPFGVNTAVDGLRFTLDGQVIDIVIEEEALEEFLANVPAGRVAAYQEFTDLLVEALAAKNAELDGALDGFSITLDTDFQRTHGGRNNQGDPLAMAAPAIVLTAPDNVEIGGAAMHQNDKFQGTYDMYNDVDDEATVSDTPARINVDLEKVGLAADGGALTIGSMNKTAGNEYGFHQAITTTDTVAGFDEFNVHVAGGKAQNSSLASLHSTNNSLRKVTIDSKDGGDANLTIGNSNTDAALRYDSEENAQAFKDVQIMDASAFNGDLTLFAGITRESVDKYLANAEGVSLYGLDSARNELAAFDYQGGNGNDVLDIRIDGSIIDQSLDGALYDVVGGTTDTNGFNVFQMNINGGAGFDWITVGMDAASASTGLLKGASNITINGGAGNDIIDITSGGNGNTWTFTIAFDGNFGHDTIYGFDTEKVTVSNEVQKLDLTGFLAHAGEQIVVTVGDKTLAALTVGADQTDAQIAATVANILKGGELQAGYAEEFFTTAAPVSVGDPVLNLERTGLDQKRVTVEIQKHVEHGSTWAPGTAPVHSATSEVLFQGGMLGSVAVTGSAAGGDVLDFSSYNAKSVIVDGTAAGYGTDAYNAADYQAGDVVVNMVLDVHNSGSLGDVYNVFLGNSDTAIGSIEFVGGADLTGLDANSFVFA